MTQFGQEQPYSEVTDSGRSIALSTHSSRSSRDLEISGRIAIAGFDDTPIAAQVVPSLTTLRVPRYYIGQRAGEMIRARLGGEKVKPRIVDTGYELVKRKSA